MGHGERDGVTLPNPVRSASGYKPNEVWHDFKNYLFAERQSKAA